MKQEKNQIDDHYKHFNHLTKQISLYIFSPPKEKLNFLEFLLENIFNDKIKKKFDFKKTEESSQQQEVI